MHLVWKDLHFERVSETSGVWKNWPAFARVDFISQGVPNVIQGANRRADPCSSRVVFSYCSPRSCNI